MLLLALLLGSAVAVFYLDRLVVLSRDTFEVVALAPEATQLRVGAEVWLAGRPVGRVEAIEFVEATPRRAAGIALRVRLPAELRPLLRRDSPVRLTRARLTANPAVEFRPGSPDSPKLEPGDTVRLEPLIDPAELADRAATLLPAVDSLIDRTAELAPAAERRSAELAALGRAIPRVAESLDALTRAAEGGSLELLLTRPEPLEALDRAAADFRTVADRLRARAAEAGELAPAFSRLGSRAAAVAAALGRVGDRLAGGGGVIPRMAADSALRLELRATSAQLDSLIAEAKEDPLRYVF